MLAADSNAGETRPRFFLAGAHAGAVRKAAATSGKLDKITSSFPHHVLRLLVITQSDKARVPEVIVRRPLREFELPDEDRLRFRARQVASFVLAGPHCSPAAGSTYLSCRLRSLTICRHSTTIRRRMGPGKFAASWAFCATNRDGLRPTCRYSWSIIKAMRADGIAIDAITFGQGKVLQTAIRSESVGTYVV
jgi:hypothetical protein